MKFIQALLGTLVTVIVATFAVTNPQVTTLYLTPFHNALEYPLYMIILGALAAGFLIGCVTVWINMDGLRKQNRQYKRDIKKQEAGKLSSVQDEQAQKEGIDHERQSHNLLRD